MFLGFTKSQIIQPSVKLVLEELNIVKQESANNFDEDDDAGSDYLPEQDPKCNDGDPLFSRTKSKKKCTQKRKVQVNRIRQRSVRVIRRPKRFESKTKENLKFSSLHLDDQGPRSHCFSNDSTSCETEIMKDRETTGEEKTDEKTPNKRRKLSSLPLKSDKGPRQGGFYYTCAQCDYKVRHRDKMVEHYLTVHEGLNFNIFLECKICQEKMKSLASLVDHLKNNHEISGNTSIFCFQCSESFTTKQLCELHNHLDHTGSPHILCEVENCKDKFISCSDYYQHLKSHCTTDDLIYSCEQCERTFLGFYQCELHKLYHVAKNDEGFYACSIEHCQKFNKFRNISKLVNHYNQQHILKELQLKLHKCDQCKKAPYFIFKNDLLLHLKRHVRKFMCQFCQEMFVGYNALTVHQFNQHPDEFKGNLIRTQRQITGEILVLDASEAQPSNIIESKVDTQDNSVNVNSLLRQCAYCGKTFTTFSEMEKHKIKEHQVKQGAIKVQVQCEICGLSLLRAHLSRHMVTHNDPHMTCPYPPCTKKFRREQNLKMHVKSVHDRKESDREFVCETCGRKYLTQGLLNRHVKERHIKPYACHLCPKTFSTVFTVNEHLRAAHTNEKFKCKWCPSEFSWLCKLKFHAKKKHPEQAHLISSIYNYAMKPKGVQYSGLTIYDKDSKEADL